MYLSEQAWQRIEPLIPPTTATKEKGGRPQASRKKVIEGIIWVLVTGERWKDLPKEYPSYQTCHRVFQQLERMAVFDQIFRDAVLELERRGLLDLTQSSIDGSFIPAKKGAHWLTMGIKEKAPTSWPLLMATDPQYRSILNQPHKQSTNM